MTKFRDEDTGDVIDVPFDEAMQACGDYLTYDDRTLVRVREREVQRKPRQHAGRIGNLAYNRPLESIGASVHRSQAKEFNELYAQHGISGAHHEPDGMAVFETRNARREVCKLRNMRDNDAGYGDYAGR